MNGKKILVLAFVVLLASLACSKQYEFTCAAKGGAWVEGTWENDIFIPAYCDDSKPDTAESENAADIAPACDAIAELEISYTSPEVTIYEDGTSVCEYRVSITNTHDASVWIWVDLHVLEGDSGMEYTQWTGGEHAYSAGYEGGFSVTHTTYYNDPDYEGPNASIPVRVAAIYKTDECTPLKDKSAFVEQIAVPLDVLCP